MPRVKPRPSLDALQPYAAKRRFGLTPEPPAEAATSGDTLSFVVQKHWASRLHYDFRLEWGGVMWSWAVPKGPCYDPAEKRIAVHVEDHPVAYSSFEGVIPKGLYGAGRVIVWDRGRWSPVGDAAAGMDAGKIVFDLHGEKLAGRWELVRIAKPGDKQDAWMLFKKRDAWARALDEYDVISALPDSVIEHPLGPIEVRQPRGASAAAAAPQRASELPGAVPGELPATLAPQLATAAEHAPTRGEWLYELKFDGYRLLTRIDAAGRVQCFTRNGHDWTSKLKPLAEAITRWGLASTWLDGEIVVQRADGTPDFNALQNAIDSSKSDAIRYFLFDLPFHDGIDLRASPLYARRALLKRLVDEHDGEHVSFSTDFPADVPSLLDSARKLGLEGIVAKRADAPYVSRRADTWLKLKIAGRQELVIGGFTERQGARGEVGSLILGVFDAKGQLVHAGSVGTGWDAATAAELYRRLVAIETKAPPFAAGSPDPGRWSRRGAGQERWVKPELAAEVRFAGWTPDGHVRHAVFLGLREGPVGASIVREPVASTAPRDQVGRIKVTHASRVIDASSGLTKLELVRYYESVAERILPHLIGRPVSLVRGPDGVDGTLFFQKHDEGLSIPGLRTIAVPGEPDYLEVADADALIACTQMNVIEFHTWNSTVKKLDRPDRLIFDLDPGEGVAFDRVREGALLVRAMLDELGLASFVKTSGGKGLHLVVPIVPKLGYDAVKDFSQAVVNHLARTIPSRFVARSGAANRVGRIFVDYLRNGRGATTAAAFSARARPGLGVSMPIAWDDLASVKSGDQWNIATAREHLSLQPSDPWAAFVGIKQTLAGPIKRLGLAASPAPR
jgi:bifunctional non-homologous end joining protein LigD